MSASSLTNVLVNSRTLIVLGAGGVGKTSLSAALALQAAMAGRKVLCLTIDPARRLANSLGLDRLSGDPLRISPELLSEFGLRCKGELYAMVLDKQRTFDDLVRKYAPDPERLERILNNRLYRYITTSLAGTQEYMAMEKLYQVHHEGLYDLVVVDTPPTSEVFGFLDAPDLLVNAIDSPATRWILQTLGKSGTFSFSLVSKGAATLLRGLSRLTGAQFMQEVAGFMTEFNTLFGGFRHRATLVRDALRQPEVNYLVVTNTSPPALTELRATVERLTERQLHPSAVVFNRVQQSPGACDEVLAADLGTLFPNHPDLNGLLARMQQAHQQESQRAGLDRATIASFRLQTGTAPSPLQIEVPLMTEDIHDLGGLADLGQALLQLTPEL